MNDFNRKVEGASARVSQTINDAAERLEKEIPEFIKYLNDEVVPAVRTHSTKALRVASQKLTEFADYMETTTIRPNSASTRVRRRCIRTCAFIVSMVLIVLIALLFLSACGHPKTGACRAFLRRLRRQSRNRTGRCDSLLQTFRAQREKPPTPEDRGSRRARQFLPTRNLSQPRVGLASWYGPPYHNRRGSNGEVYNMHAMTAAHRTYPLGSIVRVTNLKTGIRRWCASPTAGHSFPAACSISRSPPLASSTSGSRAWLKSKWS